MGNPIGKSPPVRRTRVRLRATALLFVCSVKAMAGHLDEGDPVAVSMNKVWPFHNPMETYSYYDAIPACQPTVLEYAPMSFGQEMRGDRLVNSVYDITYLKPVSGKVLCRKVLKAGDIAKLTSAIDKAYIFDIYVRDLPVMKPIGLRIVEAETRQPKYYLVTHLHFHLGYNDNEVVSARITSDEDLLFLDPKAAQVEVEFKYSVDWEPDSTPIHGRLQTQLIGALSPTSHGLDIHWLAITNSFVLVLFITSILMLIILRTVRTDLARYLRIPDEELVAAEDETGWKLLHADVFRAPPHRMWFCACIGSGAHLFLVTTTLVMFGCISPYLRTGALLSGGVFGYLLTSCTLLPTFILLPVPIVAGYISANLYRRLGGVQWGMNIFATLIMFAERKCWWGLVVILLLQGPLLSMWSILNTIALFYRSTAALPFSTTVFFFLCWFFVTLPLTVLGAVMGRRRANQALEVKAPFPCKTNRLAREIPMAPWRNSPWTHVLLSGFLPFSAIYIELHYVFLSVWGSKIYTLYGVLLVAFLMLLTVAGTVSVLLTYLHLNGEDHKWWWRAFASGGSVAIFFFLHCIYYFLTSTRMFGFLQCAFFFGYSLVVAWALFLMIGFVTFVCNYFFVTYIYSRIKSD